MSAKHGSESPSPSIRRTHRRRLDSCFSYDSVECGDRTEQVTVCSVGQSSQVSQEDVVGVAHERYFADECPICRDRDIEIDNRIKRLLNENGEPVKVTWS